MHGDRPFFNRRDIRGLSLRRNEMNPKGPNLKVVPIMLDSDDLLPKYAPRCGGCRVRPQGNHSQINHHRALEVGVGRHGSSSGDTGGHVRAPGTALGLSCNHGITLANAPGIIDPGYRGEIRCKLVNLSDEPYTVYPLERIAQLVFLPFVNAVFTTYDSLPESSRGEDGYGSTGAM